MFISTLYITYHVTRPLNIPSDQTYHFKSGSSASDLARILHLDGHLDKPNLLIGVARFSSYERKLKAGEYRFGPEFNMLQVLDRIVEGRSIGHPILFIEGWTFKDYLKELKSKNKIEHTLVGFDYEQILKSLSIEQNHPEGWFFPDTYNFSAGQTDKDILKNSYQAMKRHLENEWENRDLELPYKTAYEALIAASIIQKESRVAKEYPLIAGVIVNRLNRRMRLQMDPTVIYGLGGIDGPLLRSHLDIDTPYNTYTRHGLPPTPISMPGLLALQAAVRPAKTTALYFVARGDGSHTFSNTLEEHIAAVQVYRNSQNND